MSRTTAQGFEVILEANLTPHGVAVGQALVAVLDGDPYLSMMPLCGECDQRLMATRDHNVLVCVGCKRRCDKLDSLTATEITISSHRTEVGVRRQVQNHVSVWTGLKAGEIQVDFEVV